MGIQKIGGGAMKSNYTPPTREDFVSEEEYQKFLAAYEAAVYLSEEMEKESHYESDHQ